MQRVQRRALAAAPDKREGPDMTHQKFTIGSQWMTEGGWHAVIVRDEKDRLLVWHNFPEKVRSHDEEGLAMIADPDYNITRPWVPTDEIETIEIGGIEVPRPTAHADETAPFHVSVDGKIF